MFVEPSSERGIAGVVCHYVWDPILELLGLVLQGLGSWFFGCFLSCAGDDGTWIPSSFQVRFYTVTVFLEVVLVRAEPSRSQELTVWDVVDKVSRMARFEMYIGVSIRVFGVHARLDVSVLQLYEYVQVCHLAVGAVCREFDGGMCSVEMGRKPV